MYKNILKIDKSFRKNSLSINRAVDIEIACSTNLRLVNYIVFARGKLLLSSTLNAMKSKKFSFKFLPTFEMVPLARLLAYYITEKGEMISDSIQLEFSGDLKNFVSLIFFKLSTTLLHIFRI